MHYLCALMAWTGTKSSFPSVEATVIYVLDIGRSVYHFFAIYIHSNEIHNVAALIVY